MWEEVVKERPNRFMVITQSGLSCHLHDPGRLKELIYPGNKILVRKLPGKKTTCSVVAGWDGTWVIVDSRLHPILARKFLPGNVKSEVKVGGSRLDFQFDDTWVEVKGCSLVKNGVALFPDAPTKRGQRHLKELTEIAKQGHRALLMILVMRAAKCFLPNEATDMKFSSAFWEAMKEGVKVEIKDFKLEGRDIIYISDLELCEKV
nr:DNA/RNA nuclease SfsA [Metallosphaera hakonensis]